MRLLILCLGIVLHTTRGQNSVPLNSTFQTLCEQLNEGTTKSLYYRSTCYVSTTDKQSFDDIECTDIPHNNAHLAVVPGVKLPTKIIESGLIESRKSWVGLKRNQSASASKEFWYWQTGMYEYYAPAHITNWIPGEPDNSGIPCGVTEAGGLFDVTCPSKYFYICQYRDHRIKFIEKMQGVRGAVNMTIQEYDFYHPLKCAEKCSSVPVCQSYSMSKGLGLCALHMLPASELITEPFEEGYVFDIVEN